MGEENALGVGCRRDGIAGTGKGHKEGIALGVDLVTVMDAKNRTQQVAALPQHACVAPPNCWIR